MLDRPDIRGLGLPKPQGPITVSCRGANPLRPGQSLSSCKGQQPSFPQPVRPGGAEGPSMERSGECLIFDSVIPQPQKQVLEIFRMFHGTIRIVIIPWKLLSQFISLSAFLT